MTDQNTEPILNFVTEAQERAARDLVFINRELDLLKNSGIFATVQNATEAHRKVLDSVAKSMEPILKVARDAQEQIKRLGIDKELEQFERLREPTERMLATVMEMNKRNLSAIFPDKKETLTFIPTVSPNSKVNDQLHELIGIAKSIEAKIAHKKGPTGPKFPFTIPAGTVWETIIIQFTSNNYVNVQVAGHSHATGYADMGFANKNTKEPIIQWGLLLILAKNGGSIKMSDGDASNNFKKQKQLLSDKLKNYFGIDYDPFRRYSSKDGYKIKITLVPPSTSNVRASTDETLGEISEMFRNLQQEDNE